MTEDDTQLENRVEQLEETIKKMLPSRREALGMGVAGLAGASLMSGTASAGSSQVGTIGSASQQVDLFVEDLEIGDTVNGASVSGAAAGEALLSDGSGGFIFGSGGGGILRNGSEIDYVALDVSNLPASTGSGEVALVTASDQYVEDNPPSGTPFDITSSEFAFDTSINTQASLTEGIAWNDDGSRLYEVSGSQEEIYQYTVSTPFDVSSASFQTSISTQDDRPVGLAWNNNGTRLYEVNDGFASAGPRIYQSTVSTPFDITSASFQTSISTEDSDPTHIAWNDDGSRLYELGEGSFGDIYQYSVSTPFDISSASFSSSINTQDTTPEGMGWGDNGSLLYEVADDNIYQYSVGTPYDITSASLQTSINTNNNESFATDIKFSNDGSIMHVSIISPDIIQQYTVTAGGWEAF